MAEILCAGVSHYTAFAYPDERMADILRRHLNSDKVPPDWKDPRSWPPPMVQEFGVAGERATASAAIHRARVMGAYREVRAAIDRFQPDFVLIWGDDQYENFKEDLVPPFCLSLAPSFDTAAHRRGTPWALAETHNIWDEPTDQVFRVQGHPAAARYLTRRLLEQGFAIPYAYKPLHHEGLAHSFMNTLWFLDYDRRGFEHRLVPFHVNCYGSSLIRNRGFDTLGDGAGGEPDPPAPAPRLCFDIGAATARILRDSPWRVELIGSSSWSHAFLTAKHHYLYPDVEADRQRYEELRAGEQARWRDLPLEAIEAAGQHEFLNWICLAGALTELECRVEILDFSETYIFNSTKCTMLARPATDAPAPARATRQGGSFSD